MPPLLDWIPQLTPKYFAPYHLGPLIEVLENIRRGIPQKVVVHTPPRHGKTETLLHAIAWFLRERPDWTIGYCSYNQQIAFSKSRVALQLAKDAGVRLVTTNVGEWRTPYRGGCLATGIGGTLTGQGLNIGITDDPIKNRAEAESAVMRQKTWDWFTDTFLTRIEPNGSVIVNMARWHPDDLAGRLIRDKGWKYICLPALTEQADGTQTSLWPERWPVADLLAKQFDLGPYSWESLFQGQPRPRGGSVFGDPRVWTELPVRFREGWGIDLAYSGRSTSDYSVLMRILEAEGLYYVVDVLREQVRAPVFKARVREKLNGRMHIRPRWYASGVELGAADFFAEDDGPGRPGIKIEVKHPFGDKFTRAQPLAAAWNEGRVLVPDDHETYAWVSNLITEYVNFTGKDDEHDDQIDAGTGAFDQVYRPLKAVNLPSSPSSPGRPTGFGRRA